MIATILAIGAIAAPTAQAGGLLSTTTSDPPCATWTEEQSFLGIYSHPATTPAPCPASVAHATVTPVASTTQGSQRFQYGDAAIGAGVMAGLVLLAMAGALAVRRHSQLPHL
jgi:hypothetical protein